MRVFFPKYLNRNKLLYKLEYDEWFVILVTFFTTFYVLGFFLMLHAIISFIASYFVTRSVLKYYTDIYKEKSPGFLYHFFYDHGFVKPTSSEDGENDKDIKFPYGYETEFKD